MVLQCGVHAILTVLYPKIHTVNSNNGFVDEAMLKSCFLKPPGCL